MNRVVLATVAVMLLIGIRSGNNVSIASRSDRPVYSGPTLLSAVREGKFDPVLLPRDDSIQQRWIYAAMVQGFRRGFEDAKALVLVNHWDGCTMWPAEYPCPYYDAVRRSKLVRDGVIARMASAVPPSLAGYQPKICYCGRCVSSALAAGDRDALAPLLPEADAMQLRWALCDAAKTNDVRAIKMLLNDAKVPASVSVENGKTPLHFAARGAIEAAQALLAAGADVNAFPVLQLFQSTPLDEAKAYGHKEMVQFLAQAGGWTVAKVREKSVAESK